MSRWVEFDKANSKCYSIELARTLMVASAEVDVLAKMICKSINPRTKARNITAYQNVIAPEYPKIHRVKVELPKYGLTLTPWAEWKEEETAPIWWKANNNVKHHRSEFFADATLKNALNSVAGLLIFLALHYGRQGQDPLPAPNGFQPTKYAYKDRDVLVFRKG